MRRTPLLGAAALLCALSFTTACGGGGDSGGQTKEEMVKELSENVQADGQGLSKKDADCYAEVVVDEIGVKKLKGVDLSADSPPEALKDDIAKAVTKVNEVCTTPTTTTPTTAPTTTTSGGG